MKALKKLIPAAAMLVLCAAMMTTATFAWFSMNNSVKVNSIEGNITAPVNLQISASAESGWTDSLTGITNSAGNNGINPVTTTDLTTWQSTNKADTTTGAIKTGGKLSTLNMSSSDIGKCDTTTPGYVEATGDKTVDDEGNWQPGKYFFFTYTVYLKNVGSDATPVYIDMAQTKITANASTTPNSGNLLKAVTFAAQASKVNNSDTGVTATANQQFVQDYTDSMTKVTDYVVVTGATNNKVLVNIASQSVAKVVITVWLEGTSKYCTTENVKDAALKFNFDLGFTTVATTA